jgi:hypothetical protein
MNEFDKRKYIRYPLEPNELATIYYLDEDTKKTGQRVGLGKDESFKGCCVVFVGEIGLKEGQEVLYECGTLIKVKARVTWIKKMEDQITKIGFSIIE